MYKGNVFLTPISCMYIVYLSHKTVKLYKTVRAHSYRTRRYNNYLDIRKILGKMPEYKV